MSTAADVALKIPRNSRTPAAVAAAMTSGNGVPLARRYDIGLGKIRQALLGLFLGSTALCLDADVSSPSPS